MTADTRRLSLLEPLVKWHHVTQQVSSSGPYVMAFWKDFKGSQGLKEELIPIDDHSAWFRKTKDIKIDWSHYQKDRRELA